MMTKTLLILLLAAFSIANAQENLIKDGDLENTTFSENKMVRKKPAKGIWYPYLTSDRQASLSVQTDEEKGKVVAIQTLAQPSYAYSYVGQNIEDVPDADVYVLSLDAKALTSSTSYLTVYLKINTGEGSLFFPLNEYDPKENLNNSGALRQIRLGAEWTNYTAEFDLSKTINTVSNAKNTKSMDLSKALKADRKDFDVVITCISPNAGLLFTNVQLTKKE